MTAEWGAEAAAERAQWATATARLDDFRPLLPAEEEVVAKLLSGNFDRLADGSRPEEPDPARYPAFNPWMYSLDTLLPVLDMGQKAFWRPNPTKPRRTGHQLLLLPVDRRLGSEPAGGGWLLGIGEVAVTLPARRTSRMKMT